MDHPQDSIIEAFVIDALSDGERAKFIVHVSACDACARKLQLEATLELSMGEVHSASRRAHPRTKVPKVQVLKPRTSRRASLAMAATLVALAATLLLYVRGRNGANPTSQSFPSTATTVAVATSASTSPPASQPIPFVVCPDGLQQAKCIEDAHRHGLYVSYPPWANAPPLGGGGSGQGPNGSPFS